MSDEIIRTIVDPEDIKIIDGEDTVSVRGLLKMMGAAAFYNATPRGAKNGKKALEGFLQVARRKGFAKSDLLMSAFSGEFPPSATARKLANEAAAFITTEDLQAVMAEFDVRIVYAKGNKAHE